MYPWGIIPARAGFTAADYDGVTFDEDHPRSRGVYALRKAALKSEAGSSPLARGLRSSEAGRLLGQRIIPARAGFTGRLRLLWAI